MNNGTRDYSKATTYKDPASGLYDFYEPLITPFQMDNTVKVTLLPVKRGVDASFLRQHGVLERTEP